jgi:hypothetical protein
VNAPLDKKYLYADGQPVLSLAEFQRYAYELPEEVAAPATLTRWAVGEDIDSAVLLHCFEGEARESAASSDGSLEVVRAAIERLQKILPPGDD